ncbi:hypothetical protein HNQ09_002322 [Deinococcus budaensis]|uniref:Uncharacterized protein n=1 Tax=Deinococcus budaensis TaxID=1665626 RepID=A0A7W8GFU0_9DEIO|nr:hypothetical protein [Deinococcus budaensis]
MLGVLELLWWPDPLMVCVRLGKHPNTGFILVPEGKRPGRPQERGPLPGLGTGRGRAWGVSPAQSPPTNTGAPSPPSWSL